jgi:hypothetical protein
VNPTFGLVDWQPVTSNTCGCQSLLIGKESNYFKLSASSSRSIPEVSAWILDEIRDSRSLISFDTIPNCMSGIPGLSEVESHLEPFAMSYLSRVQDNFEQEQKSWDISSITKSSLHDSVNWDFVVQTGASNVSSSTGSENFVVSFRVADCVEYEKDQLGYTVSAKVAWEDGETEVEHTVYNYTDGDWVTDLDELEQRVRKEMPPIKAGKFE